MDLGLILVSVLLEFFILIILGSDSGGLFTVFGEVQLMNHVCFITKHFNMCN